MDIRELTEEEKSVLKQCLWDMNLTPEEFFDIIEGRLVKKWPSREFCVGRLLESVNWFKIVTIFDPKLICCFWEGAARYVRANSIKRGMAFACRILQ